MVDAHHIRLRAERSGSGRIYTITCTDNMSGTATQTVTVSVPFNH